MNRNGPLGLPPGSVRALITLSVLALTAWMVLGKQPVPAEWWALTTGCLLAYFGIRPPTAPAV